MPHSTPLVHGDLDRLCQILSHAQPRDHEGFVADITPFGICYLADDTTGEVFNVPTDELPPDAIPPGRRVRFEVSENGVCHVEAI